MKARSVYELMHHHRCWEFPERSGQAKLKCEDLLFFYLGSQVRCIVGEAMVAGPAVPIEKSSPTTFDRNLFPFFAWRIPLENFEIYPSDRANLDFLMELSFAKNSNVTRPYIGLLLRVGMRTLTDEDVKAIRTRASCVNLTL